MYVCVSMDVCVWMGVWYVCMFAYGWVFGTYAQVPMRYMDRVTE